MKLAGTEESIGVETLDDYAVQKIIGWFQQQEDIDLELRSDIEFIYLPMLDEYSEVRPRALNTRLSLESEYFCSLIELFYKERNGEKREIELNKSLSDRLYEILFQFKVTPVEDVLRELSIEDDIISYNHDLIPSVPFFESRLSVVEDIEKALSCPQNRVVFLSGIPGTGKTNIISKLSGKRNSIVNIRYYAYEPIDPQKEYLPKDVSTGKHQLWTFLD